MGRDEEMGRVFNILKGRSKMNQRVFSIFDIKAEAYLQPFFATTKGVAIRQFGAAVNQEGHDLNKFTADYQLYELGEFNEKSGQITPHDNPRSVAAAIDLKEKADV